MKLGKTYFSGSITFDEGNNVIGPSSATFDTITVSNTLNVTGNIAGAATTASYIEFTDIANKPTLISSSNQLAGETVDGDLTVTGKLTAQEFHTEYVSGSIIYTSGSTKFGDSADDTHEFTGSAFIEPGLTVTGDGSNHIIKAVRAGSTRLFVGNAVNTVGINTETVNNPLTVNGGADFSGNVGIGTTTPASGRNLHIANSTTGVLRVEGTSTNGEAVVELYGKNSSGTQRALILKYDNADIFRIGTAQAVAIRFETSDTERMRIDSGGNVGIGTTSLPTTLTVGHGSHGIGAAYLGANSLPSIAGLFTDSNVNGGTGFGDLHIKSRSDYGVYSMFFHTAAANNTPQIRMTIKPDGNVGIGTTSPSAPLHVYKTADYSAIISRADWNSGTPTKLALGKQFGPLAFISTDLVETTNDTSYIALNYKSGLSTYAEGLRVDNTGNIGINTTSPNSKLTIQSGGDATLFSVRGHLSGYSYPNIFEVVQTGADAFVNVKTGAGNTITSLSGYSGTPSYFLSNVGIGTTTPVRNLDVRGPIISTRNELYSTATINSTTPYNSTIPYGWSRFYMEMPCDNVDRTVFGNINDSRVFMWIHFGDSPSRDMAHYTWMATSVPYGLASFSQLHYMDGGWNTGAFVVTRTSSGNNYTISIRVSSYYNSANTAYGDIYLLRVG